MRRRPAPPARRAGTRKPTAETLYGVSSPTHHRELDKRGAELVFRVLTGGKEKASVAIASKASFPNDGWSKTFTDPRLCAAIVDRIIFGGNRLPPRAMALSTRVSSSAVVAGAV